MGPPPILFSIGLRHLYYRIIGGFTFHHTTSLLHDSPQHSWGISIFIYHIDRIIRETGEYFGDDAHIVYVNAKIRDNSALGKLMHDFFCKDSRDMKYIVLAERVHFFKKDQKGVATMCKAMEDMRKEERMEAEYEAHLETAKRMLNDGILAYEKIAEYTGLSIEDIKSLKEN